jgi:hypothetical protein
MGISLDTDEAAKTRRDEVPVDASASAEVQKALLFM